MWCFKDQEAVKTQTEPKLQWDALCMLATEVDTFVYPLSLQKNALTSQVLTSVHGKLLLVKSSMLSATLVLSMIGPFCHLYLPLSL